MNENSNQWLFTPITKKSTTITNTTIRKCKSQINIDNINYINNQMDNHNLINIYNGTSLSSLIIENHQQQQQQKTHQLSQLCLMCRQNNCINNECCHHNNLLSPNISRMITCQNESNNINIPRMTITTTTKKNHQQQQQQHSSSSENLNYNDQNNIQICNSQINKNIFNGSGSVITGVANKRKCCKIRNYCNRSCCCCYNCTSSISTINNNFQNLINNCENIIQPTIEMFLMWFGSVKFKLNNNNNNNNMKKSNKFRTFHKYKINILRILCIIFLVNFILFSVMCSAATTDKTNSYNLRANKLYSNNNDRSATLQSRRNGIVCNSKDIRNSPTHLENLRNCTVIEGFLTLNLMEASSADFENASFPYLTEITEFLFVYRVKGLKSLGPLFPNLSVIRGKQLFEGFALIIYENFNLVDIGLKSLTLIKRGAVRIEKNPELCFLNTVNWTEIVDAKEGNIFSENKDARDCPSCTVSNQTSLGFKKEPNCWNFKDNQKICPTECEHNCNDNLQCCNKNCIGNCDINNINICHSCKNFVDNERDCRVDCPKNKYKFTDRSCITLDDCHIKTNYENNTNVPAVIFDDTCIPHCPDGYKRNLSNICVLCPDGFCIKECEGGTVDSIADAKKYRGCSHIGQKGLIINLRLGGKHLMDELENAFSSIRVIDTFLRVVRSFSLTSLSFFKNLHTINGNPKYMKDTGNYSLYVLENNNLQHIWGEGQTVKIKNGRVFFHFNEKLCYKDISDLLDHMTDNSPFKDEEVPKSSNGNRGSCNKTLLHTVVTTRNATNVIVNITNPIKYPDDRHLIAYQYYVMEAPFKNVTKHDYRNPSCDNEGWEVYDDTKKMTSHLYTRLKPFTQYAYYVKTETIPGKENGESDIDYFTTLTDTPMPIRNFRVIYRNLSSELLIKWLPPARPNGNIVLYKIKAILKPVEPIPKISYCKNNYKREETYKSSGYDNIKTISNNNNKNNNNNENDNCRECFCEKELHPGHKQLQQPSYYDYENSIVFEDAIQNFVFVKKISNLSTFVNSDIIEDFDDIKIPSRRHKRASLITNNLLNNHSLHSSTSVSPVVRRTTTTISPLTTTTTTDDLEHFPENINSISHANEKISLYDDNNQFYKYFYVEVNSSVNEYLLTKLKYFSKYYITVVACHDGKIDKNCSDIAFREAETNRFEGADNVTNVEAYLDSTTNRTYSVKVTWTPPLEPNGIILKYNIQYLSESYRDKCIPTSEFIKNNDTIMNLTISKIKPIIILQDLPTGNYELRVQAITQAGEGYWSEPPFEIYVPPTQMSWQAITGICTGILFILLVIVFLSFYVRKKFIPQTPDLTLFTSVNPEYISMQYTPDEWELPREKIIQYQELGQGSFGMVYEGVVTLNRTQEVQPCAIKTVNENATDRERINFLNEASVMKEFNTHHVVKLLGVVSRGQPTLVVMELMQKGDLKAYLRQHRPDVENIREGEPPPQPPTIKELIQMALEIADGMAYLSAKKFVHRDLAARNCMVADDLTVKIGDFGMTRDIYETDYYRKGTKGLLPVRWMSPESLKDGVFSSASDVFSFGVVLWEMATLASQPYQGLSNDQVLRYVIEGGIMESPQNVNCPNQFYNLMSKCWQFKPNARPTFMDIIQYLLETVDEETDKKFRNVSFFYSSAGQEALEQLQPSHNDTDDATVPLRMGEYGYKISVEDTLSHGHHHDSNLVEDEQAHSPYSLGSRILINSAHNSRHSNPSSHQQSSFLAAAMQSENDKKTTAPQQQQQQQKHYHSKYEMEDGSVEVGGSGEPYRIPMSIGDATTSTNINYGSVIVGGNNGSSNINYPSTSSQYRLPPTISDAINESPRLKNLKNNQTNLIGSTAATTEPFYRRILGRGIWNLRKLRGNNKNNNHDDSINHQQNDDGGSGGGNSRKVGVGSGNGTGSNGTTATKDDKKISGGISSSTNDNNGQQQQHNSNSGGSSSKKFLSSLTPSHTSQNPNYQILNESNISTGSLLDNNESNEQKQQPIQNSTIQSINNPIWEGNKKNQIMNDNVDYDNDNVNNDNEEDCSNLSLIDEQQCKKNNDKLYKKPSSYLKNSSNINTKNNYSSSSSGGDNSNLGVIGGPKQNLKTQTPYQLKEQWLKQHLAAGGNINDPLPPNGFIGRGSSGGDSTSSNDDLPIKKKSSSQQQQQQPLQKQQQYWIGKKSPSHSKNIDRSYTQDSSSPLLEMSTFDTNKDFDEIDQELIPTTTTANILKDEIIKKQ